MRRVLATLGLCLAVASTTAFAQDPESRAEALRQAREAKATSTEPHNPNPLEQALYVAEERVIPLLQRDGIYARSGSLSTGSGFALGAGIRRRALVDGIGSIDLWGAGSFKRYWSVEARGTYPILPGGVAGMEVWATRFSRPAEEFFGTGPRSRRRDHSNFAWDGTEAGGRVTLRPTRLFHVGGSVAFEAARTGEGRHDDLPSIDDLFDSGDLPGFADDLDYLVTRGFVEFDNRQPLNARKGGLYRLAYSRHSDLDADRYGFTRADIDIRQFVSFLAERRVLAGRVFISTTDPVDGAEVPFYLLPALGGNDTLRGFRANRFRGAHALLLQAEYRFEIWSALEGALFVDAGKVANRRADLDLSDLERDYGFGFRFNTDNGIIARIDAAFGSRDGRHLHVVFGGIF